MMKKIKETSITSPSQWIQHQLKGESIENYKLPKKLIVGFFPTLYQYIKQNFSIRVIDKIRKNNPFYIFSYNNNETAFVFPGFGASISSLVLEECIALGSEEIIFIGTCGSLVKRQNHLIIIENAICEDGVSQHYFNFKTPLIATDMELTNNIHNYFKNNNIQYQSGNSWTTGAVYRETHSKILEKWNQGCLCVDMEAASLISVAKYHGKKIAGFLIPSDFISEKGWHISSQPLPLSPSKLFQLALNIITS